MIDDVEVYPLGIIPDSRGRIMHYVRKDIPAFRDFDIQEIYFSMVYPGAIKAWHRHEIMTLNYAVPVGNIKLVLYDNRPESHTMGDLEEIYLGETSHYSLVRVPPGVWNGFMAVGGQSALVANVTNCTHDPKEIVRMHPDEFSDKIFEYNWMSSFIA